MVAKQQHGVPGGITRMAQQQQVWKQQPVLH
jgi:hypothetical protein